MGSFGGEFFHTSDFAKLVLAFKTIVGKIAAVNSVFAAVSLPVSVNTQGTYLNEIYVGMFRPAQGFLPQWQGNLKQQARPEQQRHPPDARCGRCTRHQLTHRLYYGMCAKFLDA